jgi:hypothetical protein
MRSFLPWAALPVLVLGLATSPAAGPLLSFSRSPLAPAPAPPVPAPACPLPGSRVEPLQPGPGRPPFVSAAPWGGAVAYEPLIQELVDQVSTDSIDADVLRLVRCGSRLANTAGAWEAAAWIQHRMRAYGIQDVSFHDFPGGYAPNVVASIPGATMSDRIYLIGGHYDSYSQQPDDAPGADDNASGTAAVLECARIFAHTRFECTLRFVAFSGEELGLLGSAAYASDAASLRENIAGMLNVDMIGYRAENDTRDLDIISDAPSDWIRQRAVEVASLYVPGFPVVRAKILHGSSDHVSFWDQGYNAIFLHEDAAQSSPFIHTPEDRIGTSYNDSILATSCIRVAVGLLATLAVPLPVPIEVEALEAAALPGGIELRWRLSEAAIRDLLGLRVQRAATAAGPWEERTAEPLAPRAAMRFADASVDLGRTYWYRLELLPHAGDPAFTGPVEAASGPARTVLLSPRPIAGGAVEVRYGIGSPGPVRLDVYDVAGRRLRELWHGRREPGEYVLVWDGSDNSGRRAARGTYFVSLEAGGTRLARRVLLL